ncbi:MAG: hypothetical protein GY860_18955 [Desulfobacteraceae bacterium]|nr:hypothetical protein [Desulfobacteraceae bacterium]
MEGLYPRQEKAAHLIAHGIKKQAAAKEVGVKPPTISEWMQNPEFVALINRIKKELMEETRDMLRGNISVAVKSIRSLIIDAKNEKVRLEAAKFVIECSGIIAPDIGLWDIGPQTADEVLKEIKNHEFDKLSPFNMF